MITSFVFLPAWCAVQYIGLQWYRSEHPLGVDAVTGVVRNYEFGEAEILLISVGFVMTVVHLVTLLPFASQLSRLPTSRMVMGSMMAGIAAAAASVLYLAVLAAFQGFGIAHPIVSMAAPVVLATLLIYRLFLPSDLRL